MLRWGIAVGLLCLLQHSAALDGPKDFRQKFKVSMEDVVVSMPVDQKHLTVARGSRSWRKVRIISKDCHPECATTSITLFQPRHAH